MYFSCTAHFYFYGLEGEGEAKLLEGNKPNQNNPQQQEAGNVKKYFSPEAAGWHQGCCKGRGSRKHQRVSSKYVN